MLNCILDTDIGSDCDDAGAMAVLHRLALEGECDILAVTHCLSRESGPACIDVIDRYYGRGDIPVGTLKQEGYYPREILHPYTDTIQKEFPSAYPPGADCPDALGLMRRILAEQTGKVTLCAIGPLTNLRLLFQSGADGCSAESGTELVRRHVEALYVMGGDFSGPEESRIPEFNIRSDVESAQYVMEHCPVPVRVLPFEVGRLVYAGAGLLQEGTAGNPVRRCYELYCNKARETWDLLTVLLMVRPDASYWDWSEPGDITIDGQGISRFVPSSRGNCQVIRGLHREQEVARLLEDLLMEPAAAKAVSF